MKTRVAFRNEYVMVGLGSGALSDRLRVFCILGLGILGHGCSVHEGSMTAGASKRELVRWLLSGVIVFSRRFLFGYHDYVLCREYTAEARRFYFWLLVAGLTFEHAGFESLRGNSYSIIGFE